MSTENYVEEEVCEACGCAGEVGYIINEGDENASVSVFASDKATLQQEFEKYVSLAKEVNENVTYEIDPTSNNETELHANFTFEVSAEKIIFELRSRSLVR